MNEAISRIRRAARLTMIRHALQLGYIPANISVVTKSDGVKLAWDAPDERKQVLLDPQFSEAEYLADGVWDVTMTQEHLDAAAALQKMGEELSSLSDLPESEQLAWHDEFTRLVDIRSSALDQA